VLFCSAPVQDWSGKTSLGENILPLVLLEKILSSPPYHFPLRVAPDSVVEEMQPLYFFHDVIAAVRSRMSLFLSQGIPCACSSVHTTRLESCSNTGLGRLLALRKFEAPRISEQSAQEGGRFPTLSIGRLFSQETTMVLITGCVNPSSIMRQATKWLLEFDQIR
jgi:hypothetical protein